MKKPKIITSYELSYSNDDKNNNQNYRNNNHCELYLYCRNTMIKWQGKSFGKLKSLILYLLIRSIF